jgi:hypothetical protein
MLWDDPLDPVVITVDEIVDRTQEVRLVIHDEGHGGWQFLDGHDVTGREPVVIPKVELLAIDPSLKEITDLPEGWRARRESAGQTWMRQPPES